LKAVYYRHYGPADVLEYGDLPDPTPGPGQILVKLEAASVSPFDWKLRAGLLKSYFDLPLPKVPGRDGAGVVVQLGQGVAGFAVGDRVCLMSGHFTQGGYAQMIACNAADAALVPDGLTTVEAAALVNAGLSAHIAAIRTADVRTGQKVLIHAGSGAVGGLLVQLCRHLGADVTATCRAVNRDYVLSLGAHRVIAYDTEELSELQDQDVVFDLVGGKVHDQSYSVLRSGGLLVWLVADPIVDRGAEFNITVRRAMISDDGEVLKDVMAFARARVLVPQVSQTIPLAQAAEAHRLMEAGAISRGRLVLTC
jgi:NADPH:quinone reductase-like Zn-dependent oxidoreductase